MFDFNLFSLLQQTSEKTFKTLKINLNLEITQKRLQLHWLFNADQMIQNTVSSFEYIQTQVISLYLSNTESSVLHLCRVFQFSFHPRLKHTWHTTISDTLDPSSTTGTNFEGTFTFISDCKPQLYVFDHRQHLTHWSYSTTPNKQRSRVAYNLLPAETSQTSEHKVSL